MFVIVGLGNPGRDYLGTRHNMGFMVLDLLSDRFDIEIKRRGHRSLFGEGAIGGERVVLAKPQTFMNNSGWAVQDLVNWYKCAPSELIVVYDDIDLASGCLRVRSGGSAGSHNGMKSVIFQLGFDSFPRVRVGIGQADGERSLVSHVLGEPRGEERGALESAVREAADAVELIVRGGLDEAQARYNRRHANRKADPDAAQPDEDAPSKARED